MKLSKFTRGLFVFFLVIFFGYFGTPPVYSNIKLNESCNKIGQKLRISNQSFECKKIGTKLIWKIDSQQSITVEEPIASKKIASQIWATPSHYELVNWDKYPDRIFIGLEKNALQKQFEAWGNNARLFFYVVSGGEEVWAVHSLKEVLKSEFYDGRTYFPLWKKTFMQGAKLKLAVGPLYLNENIPLDTFIDGSGSALRVEQIPGKNWILETQIELSRITGILKFATPTNQTPSKSPKPKSSPSISTSLPACTGTQEANLINLLSQYRSISNLISTYRNYLEVTIDNLGNAYARGAMYEYEKLLIDRKNLEAKLDDLYNKINNLQQLEKNILATCVRNNSIPDNSNSKNQNKLPCTQNEVNRMLTLISQYSTKQELIRISRSNIEKLQLDVKFAISKGSNPGIYQNEIARYSRLLQSDIGSAELIKREFDALNIGCLNSGLFLP